MCLKTNNKLRVSCTDGLALTCSKWPCCCCKFWCLTGCLTLNPAALKGVKGRVKPGKIWLCYLKKTLENISSLHTYSSWISPISSAPSTEYLVFPIQIPNLLLHSNLSFDGFFLFPSCFWCRFLISQLQLGALAEVGVGPLPIEPGSFIFELFPFPQIHTIFILCSSMSTYPSGSLCSNTG